MEVKSRDAALHVLVKDLLDLDLYPQTVIELTGAPKAFVRAYYTPSGVHGRKKVLQERRESFAQDSVYCGLFVMRYLLLLSLLRSTQRSNYVRGIAFLEAWKTLRLPSIEANTAYYAVVAAEQGDRVLGKCDGVGCEVPMLLCVEDTTATRAGRNLCHFCKPNSKRGKKSPAVDSQSAES